MSKKDWAALAPFFAAAVLAFGCGRDPGEPSFPRVQRAPKPTPEPFVELLPPIPKGPKPLIQGLAPEEEPFSVEGDVVPPVEVVRVDPDCRLLEGASRPVRVELLVAADGRVRGARLQSSASLAAKTRIFDAVAGWKFRPATLRGRAVSVYLPVVLRCP